MFHAPEKTFTLETLVALEHEMLELWERTGAFEKLRQQNRGKPRWSFLDGPITANNPMGVHHAWGRTLKDCYQRHRAMLGRELRYQNGFDCQGLWVEVEVEKELGFTNRREIEEYGLERFVEKCKERVHTYSARQTEQSIRLGYWMDWTDSYYTMTDENNYTIWHFLRKCHERGLLYKGMGAMPWCTRCEAGISEQEVKDGYQEIDDVAVYVRLPLVGRENEYLLVWTTTPWTLAANVACAVNEELTYVQARQGEATYYLVEELVEVLSRSGPYEVQGRLPGRELVGWQYEGPFDDLERPHAVREAHKVIPWKEVAATDGTGIVHIAPGCGREDFELGQELGLPVLAPIDEAGIYHDGYGHLTGKYAGDVTEEVLQTLREKQIFYAQESYTHNYPHCWRDRTKLLFRTMDAWYIDMRWRDEIKAVAQQIQWIPEYGVDLELDWLTNMGDWMISKRRYWGLALPIFECSCGHFDVIGSREELQERAVEGWEEFDGHSPHRPWVDQVKIACSKCGTHVGRIPEVGNPWLDAGIVPYSTVRYKGDREYWQQWIPADLVLECFPGQFRNWFYALLAMSTMMENIPPFRTLLGHALVRDEEGREMHKSLGNAIWFDDAAERMGVDAMRWLFCRQNPTHNLNFGYGTTEQIRRRVFNTFWNVYTFLINYARADRFDPGAPPVPLEERQDIDRWLLSRLHQLLAAARDSLERYDASTLVRQAEGFIDSLSTWYVRRCRRRFWRPRSADDRDKLAAYQTLYETLVTLCQLLAPVIPFLTEKMYQNLVRSVDQEAPESVHHCPYPEVDPTLLDEELARDMDLTHKVVSMALGLRESRSMRVRQPLPELVVVGAGTEQQAVERFSEHILDELNLKHLRVQEDLAGLAQHVVKPDGRILGPKYGGDLPRIRQALGSMDATAVAATVAAGELVVVDDGDRSWRLLPEEVMVETRYPDHLVAAEDRGLTVILDVTVTPELEREGLARDVVRHIQTARKELDLELTDHIQVSYDTDDTLLEESIQEHREYICTETLGDQLTRGELPGRPAIKLQGHILRLQVTRVQEPPPAPPR